MNVTHVCSEAPPSEQMLEYICSADHAGGTFVRRCFVLAPDDDGARGALPDTRPESPVAGWARAMVAAGFTLHAYRDEPKDKDGSFHVTHRVYGREP